MHRQHLEIAKRCITFAVLTVASGPAFPSDTLKYNRDVRPILAENCFACHGPDKKARKADLRLDIRDEALKAGAIAPGKPEESELVERIFSSDKKKQMPPPKAHKTLTKEQKETLRRWVASGAEYQLHWAYIVPERPALPILPKSPTIRNPIDSLIQHGLAARGIKPSQEADRRTLLRRLSLDLIGMPPMPEEVDAFLKDSSPNAFEKQVDRLLRSPHYGERMAQPWLDVARYADTVGYHGDQNQNVWAYRDYVIRAFNDNKPFDQFTIEQLAGDLLPNPTVDQRIATCFNRLNMMTREGGAQAKEYLAKYTADRIRTVGMAWLGSTLNCCECHDHKFDPFTMKDFYSLGAFFADVKQWGVYQDYEYTPNPELRHWSNDHPWPPEIVVDSPALHRRLERLQRKIQQTLAEAKPDQSALSQWRHEILAYLKVHPSGWETHLPRDPSSFELHAAKPKTEGRSSKLEARSTETKLLPSPKIDKKDGRVVFATAPATSASFDIAPSPGWLAAIKIELLPDASHDNKIVRIGNSTNFECSFALARKDGATDPIHIRHAQADHAAPRYANGFEIIGVRESWKTDPADVKKPHTAVFFLDQPIPLQAGDRLQVRLSDNTLGCIRISSSPLAPVDLHRPEFDRDLTRSLDNSKTAAAFYLRSTAWNRPAFERLKRLEADGLACRDGNTPVMVTEQTNKPLTIRVLARGNWMDDSGAICQAETPGCLPKWPDPDGHKLTRLDLARWLCSPSNPLTARTIVNRLWKQLFGAGLSTQVDDLGTQGEAPVYPELLDWLAVEFRESGWNIKHVVKLMVMSHTYRQSSESRQELREIDPNNRLLASQNPRRLEAEVVRDNALAIARLINLDMGGPPCFPYQPAHYYDAIQFPDRDYFPDRDENQYRRGIYMHWQRTFLHPMLANFDAPSREDCIVMRTNANSPQQALTLLNDPTFVEAARVWAAKLLALKVHSDADRLAAAFERALARPPRAEESTSLLDFLNRMRAEYKARPDDTNRLGKVGIAASPSLTLRASIEPMPGRSASEGAVELAAWTNVCRAILNLHETITRF